MQILPQGPPGIGELLGQGLSDIAGHWAGIRTTEKAMKGLGFSPAEAKAYAHLSPQVQQQAIQARQQEQAQSAFEQKMAMLNARPETGGQPSYAQPSMTQPSSQSQSPQGMPQRSSPQEQQQQAIQQATSIAQNPNFRKLNEQQQAAQAQQQQQIAQRQGPQANQLTGEQQAILQSQAQQAPRKPTYEDKIDNVNRKRQQLSMMGLKPNDRFKAEALLNSEEDRAIKEKQHADKQADEKEKRMEKREDTLKKELDDVSKRAERAQQDIHLLSQIKAANDSGTLVQGPKRRLLENLGKKYGFDFQDYFTNTTTQFTAKAIERMQTGAGTAFGTGRLTNFIADAYSKSLPRLANTQEGMDLIVKNLTLEDKGHIALNDEIRKIKAEYREAGRILPTDIIDMARERVQPTLDKYAQEALGNIEAAVARQEGLASGKIQRADAPPRDLPDGAIVTDRKSGKKTIVENGKLVPYQG